MGSFVVQATTDAVIDHTADHAWEELEDALGDRFAHEPDGVAVAPFDGRVGAVITVEATNLHDAGRLGTDALLDALTRQGIAAHAVAVEVLTELEFDRRTQTSRC